MLVKLIADLILKARRDRVHYFKRIESLDMDRRVYEHLMKCIAARSGGTIYISANELKEMPVTESKLSVACADSTCPNVHLTNDDLHDIVITLAAPMHYFQKRRKNG